jgi:hypothetical protein
MLSGLRGNVQFLWLAAMLLMRPGVLLRARAKMGRWTPSGPLAMLLCRLNRAGMLLAMWGWMGAETSFLGRSGLFLRLPGVMPGVPAITAWWFWTPRMGMLRFCRLHRPGQLGEILRRMQAKASFPGRSGLFARLPGVVPRLGAMMRQWRWTRGRLVVLFCLLSRAGRFLLM